MLAAYQRAVGRGLVTAMTRSGVQVAFLDATRVANEAISRHEIESVIHAEALARALSGAVLLNMNMKVRAVVVCRHCSGVL